MSIWRGGDGISGEKKKHNSAAEGCQQLQRHWRRRCPILWLHQRVKGPPPITWTSPSAKVSYLCTGKCPSVCASLIAAPTRRIQQKLHGQNNSHSAAEGRQFSLSCRRARCPILSKVAPSRDPATGLPVYRMSVATRGSSATTGLPPTTHLSHTAPLSYVVWDPCHLHQHIGHESRQACQKKHAFRRRGATIRGDGSGVEAGRSCQKEPPAGC
jgi:hypothetical protein